jgi:hypothetical protein
MASLSPLGERVARAGAFTSRRGTGEGVRMSADGYELNQLTKRRLRAFGESWRIQRCQAAI